MSFPVLVTFRNLPGSPVLEKVLREKFDKLDSLGAQVQGCLIAVEAPLQTHFVRGKPYLVRVSLNVLGEEIVINGQADRTAACNGLCTAISSAFESARILLQDYVDCRPTKRSGRLLLTFSPSQPIY